MTFWVWIRRWQFDWHVGLYLSSNDNNEGEPIIDDAQTNDSEIEVATMPSSSVRPGVRQNAVQDGMRVGSAVENKNVNDKAKRVKSLDAFRGFSITVMIFVNYGGGGYW